MQEKKSSRRHFFVFPGKTGGFSLELENGCFPDIDDDELYSIGKVVNDFLNSVLLENREMRENYVTIFQSVLKDAAASIEDKDLDSLLKYSNRAFKKGDYHTSLFLSKLILARLNAVIDKKIENNDRLIDKEIIHLQISVLNFIGYLFSKLNTNIDYGLKLTTIADTLLNEFDENSDETISMRSAILDTLGCLYLQKKEFSSAIDSLTRAHECDRQLLSHEQLDEISYRLTCSNLGYALAQNCLQQLDDEQNAPNIQEIEENLKKASTFFMMVRVDKSPVVPEKRLKDLELAAAIKLMKQGLAICDEVKKKLQKRFI